MDKNFNNQILDMQKNFYELNNLFELSILANQSADLKEFIDNLSSFIKLNLNLTDVNFFLKDGNDFSITNSMLFLELLDNEEAIWHILREPNIIAMKGENGEILFKSFFESNGLNKINSSYLRGLTKDAEFFAICSLGNKADGKFLEETELSYLNKIFNYVEPILHKFVIREKQQYDLKYLYKTLHNVSILYNISQAVNFIDDLKRLLNVILDKALETVDAEKGSLMLYDISDNTLQVKVVYGLKDKKVEDDINSGVFECSKIRVGEGIAGLVFSNKTSIISNLGESDPRFVDISSLSNVNSLLCVPLIAKGEAIGVINISNKNGGKLFNKQDLEFMEALANQAAIAIDNAKLYELATKDGLTKLYTYRHFYTMLENEIRRAGRYGHNLSILMMDIDNFKQINDTYGHPVGDHMLRDIASVIENTIRKIDMPARYGGEEFAVILPETGGEEAVTIAQRLRANIEKVGVKIDDKTTVKATISIGISTFPTTADDEDKLIQTADVALYAAKDCGKNCVYLYKEGGSQECKVDF